MKSFRNLFSLVLIAILFSVLVACQDKDNSKGGITEPSGDGTEPIEFTIFDSDSNADWEDMKSPIGQKIKEDTGVTIKPEFDIDGGQQKIPLMAASGEYPDFILPKGQASMLVEAGALIDLTDLIEEHAPNIKKMLGEDINRLKWSEDDPSIYIITNAAVDNEPLNPSYGALLQHEVVQEQGYPEMRTLDDFENAIKEYMAKHPEIDGRKTIGLTLQSDGWQMQSATLNSGYMMTGGSDDGEYYIDPETYEATLHYRRPVEKEVFRWYNHMNAEGLLDPESFVQKDEQYKEKLATGRAIATIAPDWMVGEAQNSLRDSGMHEKMYGMYPVTLSEEYKHAVYQSPGLQVGWGIGITVDNEDPVRAIKFLDYLVAEETQVLTNWGIEGKHHEIDEDGNRYLTEEQWNERNNNKDFAKETGIGYNYQRFMPRYGDGVKDSTDQNYTLSSREQNISNQTDVEKEVLENYDAELWSDLYPGADEFDVKPWGAAYNIPIPGDSNLDVTNQRMLDITTKRVPEAILAKPEEFDAVWDMFMKDLEDAGVEAAEEEYTQLIKDTVELWNQ